MKSSFSVGRFFGINVFLHWSFLIFLVWIAASNAENGWANSAWVVLFMVSVFVCITLHEFGHALTARQFGIKTRDITLYPIGGVASLDKMPEKPMQEFWVALAGPMVNVVIALLLYPLVQDMPIMDIFTKQIITKELNQDTLIPALFSINVFLPLFNMIPAFPMDGGRVFRALLCLKLSRPLATRIAATLGQGFAIFLVFQGLKGNIFLIVIGIFVFIAAEGEAQYTKNAALLRGLIVRDVMMSQYPTLKRNETIENTVEALLDSPYKRFLVIEDDKVVGLLTDDIILNAYTNKEGEGEEMNVGNLMLSDMEILRPDMPLEEALLLLKDNNTFLPVHKDGHVVGVLDAQNIGRFFAVRKKKKKMALNTEGEQTIKAMAETGLQQPTHF
jgi:Zn-dependent protease/predicted transcriptional regulator